MQFTRTIQQLEAALRADDVAAADAALAALAEQVGDEAAEAVLHTLEAEQRDEQQTPNAPQP